ncbi:NnrS family protein [Aerobium aerolatum]|uniref:Uncharacterized protein involved in response to NO n=1 Tax=Aquamicrobium aerolatum DSM 21857 TaxID=1121003 RepID=A0A1I3SA62_9HYPH|nr:NnrS family protein [Aquamicrobium aerolatum]SFJ55585.1 uncharacterized protein involved in response to NO [Aquamicrobium aerolatum DSM 21857]
MTSIKLSADPSIPRGRRKAGDNIHDGRGRLVVAPPILQYGFRPFFFLAALHAGVVIPVWVWLFFTGEAVSGPFTPVGWHVHEMLFGYLFAVLAGFILTAIPNWTGRLPLSGWPLAGLVFLWLAGRLACAFLAHPVAAMAVDLACPAALALAVWREVVAGRNWKNAPVAVLLTLFGVANALDHAGNLDIVQDGLGSRLALAVIAVLIALIGGRIVPSFTRNWLAKRRVTSLPASFGLIDKAALLTTIVALAAWVVIPASLSAGLLLCLAAALLAVRLARWRGHLTVREPILLILHIGYGWLALALFMLGGSAWYDETPVSAALHALTTGAIGTMTLAVMTRASLGHTGRAITADGWTIAAYLLVNAGAVFRVAAPLTGEWYPHLLACGGAFWSAAFLVFAVRYVPILWGPRAA